MKLLFITCSFVFLVLVQVPRSYCGKEKIHLKIHVPHIINKQLHTKTVYVHVHKKPEPPKKHEHHHNHEHKHLHHTPMKKPEEPHHHHHHHHKHDGHFHHTHNIKPHHGHHNHHHHHPHGKHEGHGSHGGHGGHKGHGGHNEHGGHGGHHHHDIKPVHETPHEHHKPGSKKPIPKKPSPKKPSKKPSHGHLFSNLIHTTHEDFYHHEPEQITLNPTSDPYALNYYKQFSPTSKYSADFDYSENLSQEYQNDEPQREYEELQEYEDYETPSEDTSDEYDGPVDSYGNKVVFIYHPSENYEYKRASKRISNDPNINLVENEKKRYHNSDEQIRNDFQIPDSYNPSEDIDFHLYEQSIIPENIQHFDVRHEKFEDGNSKNLVGYHRNYFLFRPNP